jgi:hypothetical protein
MYYESPHYAVLSSPVLLLLLLYVIKYKHRYVKDI